MKKGEIYILAPPSPFNKPRPAVVLQTTLLDDSDRITVALISSDPVFFAKAFRVLILPTETNGLRKPSEILIDHLQTVPLDRIGGFAGVVDEVTMRAVDAALRIFLGLP